MDEDAELKIDADTLLVFVDDTGHEAFKGAQHYYGLGGCVILGAAYGWLKAKWLDVRTRINGSPDIPLHAADMARTSENFAVLKNFFQDRSFVRIGAASTKACTYPVDMHTAAPVMATIQEYIDWIAQLVPCNSVAVVVESSKRPIRCSWITSVSLDRNLFRKRARLLTASCRRVLASQA